MTSTERIPSIVFIDDEESILSALRSLFRKEGYQLHLFSSPEQALDFLRQQSAEIIISDMRMPVMSGIEFLSHASLLAPESFRMILSGYEDKKVVLDALNKGLAQNFIMKPWDDRTFRELIGETLQLISTMRSNKLNSLLSSFTDIPLTSKFSLSFLRMIEIDTLQLNEVVQHVESNPSLLTKVLRVANSVFASPRNRIETIREAIMFIGLDYLTGLIVSLDVYHSVGKAQSAEIETLMENLWSRSIQRALIAKDIAEKVPGFTDAPLLYIASMLQDIGMIVLLASVPDQYKRYNELTLRNEQNSLEVEQMIFSISHEKVGEMLLRVWNFPSLIIEAISRHHSTDTAGDSFLELMQIAMVISEPERTIIHDPKLNEQIAYWKVRLVHESKCNDLKETQ